MLVGDDEDGGRRGRSRRIWSLLDRIWPEEGGEAEAAAWSARHGRAAEVGDGGDGGLAATAGEAQAAGSEGGGGGCYGPWGPALGLAGPRGWRRGEVVRCHVAAPGWGGGDVRRGADNVRPHGDDF